MLPPRPTLCLTLPVLFLNELFSPSFHHSQYLVRVAEPTYAPSFSMSPSARHMAMLVSSVHCPSSSMNLEGGVLRYLKVEESKCGLLGREAAVTGRNSRGAPRESPIPRPTMQPQDRSKCLLAEVSSLTSLVLEGPGGGDKNGVNLCRETPGVGTFTGRLLYDIVVEAMLSMLRELFR